MSSFTWPEMMNELEGEVKRAKEYYQGGYLKQARMRNILLDIKKDLHYFRTWVKLLPSDRHRSPICCKYSA